MNFKHGHKKSSGESREYTSWKNMMSRCHNPNNPRFSDYGGRGVTVCSRWKSFSGFIKDMGRCPVGLTLERKSNNGNYTLSNCRWASRVDQANNTRKNIFLRFNGKVLSISQWASQIGIRPLTLRWRIVVGKWTVARALTTP